MTSTTGAAKTLTTTTPTIPSRWRPSVPLLVCGAVSIVAGGLAAAVTGPTEWDHGSWVAAFLVLVGGVAQIGIAAGQSELTPSPPTPRFVALECALWNVAGLIVIAGTLLASPLTVTIGSVVLVAALVLAAVAARGVGRSWLLVPYRALLVLLLVSTPIGIALSWTRHGQR